MSRLKKGDRVEITDPSYASQQEFKGLKKTILENNDGLVTLKNMPGSDNTVWFDHELTKIGDPNMTKYDTLKQQIEDLDGDSSLKEWDDLLQEINLDDKYYLNIKCNNQQTITGMVTSIEIQDERRRMISKHQFEYTDQCSKLEALKEAYLWLLDHSDIPKIDKKKQKKIEQLKEDISNHKKRLIDLDKRLEELEL